MGHHYCQRRKSAQTSVFSYNTLHHVFDYILACVLHVVQPIYTTSPSGSVLVAQLVPRCQHVVKVPLLTIQASRFTIKAMLLCEVAIQPRRLPRSSALLGSATCVGFPRRRRHRTHTSKFMPCSTSCPSIGMMIFSQLVGYPATPRGGLRLLPWGTDRNSQRHVFGGMPTPTLGL